MQISRIEQRIEDVYSFVESCKMQHLSTTKVVVPKNELYDLLDDLRREVPGEIKRYQKILSQRDAIIEDANYKANEILEQASKQYNALVEEHSIMKEACLQAEAMVKEANERAQAIIEDARRQSAEICEGAIMYSADMLEYAEKTIDAAFNNITKSSNELQDALKNHLDVIRSNKAELTVQLTPQQEEPPQSEAMEEEYDEIVNEDLEEPDI